MKRSGLFILILLPTGPLGARFSTCPNAENSTAFTPICLWNKKKYHQLFVNWRLRKALGAWFPDVLEEVCKEWWETWREIFLMETRAQLYSALPWNLVVIQVFPMSINIPDIPTW